MSQKIPRHEPTWDLYIPRLVEASACEKHNAVHGMACYYIPGKSGAYYSGVCDRRARNSGFNGKISENSLSTTRNIRGRK